MPRTKTQDSCFSIGDEVEVTSADHSLRGTLFPAKIIGRDWNTDKFVVEYKHLEANDEPLREEVELVLLRPLPPMPEHGYTFVFGDEVDAFFSGGWWEGVITEVDDEGSMFWVYFRFAKQQFQFLASELRIHQEWDKGTWFPSRVRVSTFFFYFFNIYIFIYFFCVVFTLNINCLEERLTELY